MSDSLRRYLDYAATTPLDERVLEAMMPFLGGPSGMFGNASALYSEGKAAHAAVEDARRIVAGLIGVRDPYEIVFTSGGTESDNMAVRGMALAARSRVGKAKGPGHVVASSFEHKAVLDAVRSLKADGFEVTFVDPDPSGFVAPASLEAAMRPDTLVVSVMMANNEVGTVQPVRELAEVSHARGALFHTDAVAAVGKVPVDVAELGVDALSFTAHKICGPKGTGALYLSKRAPFSPILHGGGQERGKRPGTYNAAGIVGLARAVELACGTDAVAEARRLCAMRDAFIQRVADGAGSGFPAHRGGGAIARLATGIPDGDVSRHLPGLVPLLFADRYSEDLVMDLDLLGFAVSGGSACTASQAKPSHVLKSMGYDDEEASRFLRVSFGRFTEQADLDDLADALAR
ncbi:MAG: cysteine desulfurase family protein [Coriobacteriales bacterium]